MNRSGSLMFLLALVFILTAGSSLMAQSDLMLLNSREGLPGKKRPPVPFPHALHTEQGGSCKDCHHLFEKGENILDESTLEEGNKEIQCRACHGPGSRLNLERAYHRQCIGCHKNPAKEQKKIPPRYCGGCHVRK